MFKLKDSRSIALSDDREPSESKLFDMGDEGAESQELESLWRFFLIVFVVLPNEIKVNNSKITIKQC